MKKNQLTRQTDKRIPVIIGSLQAFFLLALLAGLCLISCAEKRVLPNLYLNEEEGFSFEYPDNYQRISVRGNDIVQLSFRNREKIPVIVASKMTKEGNPTYARVAENFIAGIKQGFPDGYQFEMSGIETVMLNRKTEAGRFQVNWVLKMPEYFRQSDLETLDIQTSVIAVYNEKKDKWIVLSVTQTPEILSPKDVSDILLSLKILR